MAAVLCMLVAGFLFAFTVVVMPGLRKLADREFLETFRCIDGVIQKNPPVFVLIWGGSIVAALLAVVLGVSQSEGLARFLVVVAGLIYLVGVQLPTFVVNVPLNNELQALDLPAMSAAECEAARRRFEPRWNRWNEFRTCAAIFAALLMATVLWMR
jgi:uncharacterized membrane protein